MTDLDRIRALAERLEAMGCTPLEIEQIESAHGRPLPGEVRVFLETMGRDVGGLFGGSDVGYPSMLRLRRSADELLEENDCADVLPENALVVMMHQGYAIWFVSIDDPRVRCWSERFGDARRRAEVVANSLADFLVGDLELHGLSAQAAETYRTEIQASRQVMFIPPPCSLCGRPVAVPSYDTAHPLPSEPVRLPDPDRCDECTRILNRPPDGSSRSSSSRRDREGP